VCLLIERGADVNARGDFGETPLHYAVRDDGAEAIAIVARLLQAGADVQAKDERLRQNALGFALREFNDDLEPAIQMLRERGSSLGLEGAMILGDLERVKQLLSEPKGELPVELMRAVLDLAQTMVRAASPYGEVEPGTRREIASLIESQLQARGFQ